MPQRPVLLDIDAGNLNDLPCCGIKNPDHPGLVPKRRWLREQFKHGLRAKALLDEDGKPCGYIEYLPGEYAWRSVDARGYMFIHCIWNHSKRNQGKGWGRALVECRVADAKAAGMPGVAVMTRKGPWLAGGELFQASGFELVASAPPDYELWVRKFKARSANPAFKADCGATAAGMKDRLTIVRAAQCPYVAKFAGEIAQAAEKGYGIVPKIIEISRCPKCAHALCGVFDRFEGKGAG
jgi:N-acetylglutamate synthase-like GNAT family acetyltransferase